MAQVRISHSSVPQHIQAMPTSSNASDFQSKVLFDEIEKELAKNGEEFVKKVKGVFCFKVKSGNKEGCWVVDVKNGKGGVKYGDGGKGDVTISIADDDFMKLAMGQLNPQQAFFQGKFKLAGNIGLALKVREVIMNADLMGTKAKL